MCKDQVLNNAMQEGHVLTEEDQVLEHSDLQDRGTNGKRLTPRTLPFRKKKKNAYQRTGAPENTKIVQCGEMYYRDKENLPLSNNHSVWKYVRITQN